jgi:hypothetical protein
MTILFDHYVFSSDIIVRMTVTSFKIGKQEFVVIPRKRYDRLTRVEQDQRDADIARKGRTQFLSGKMKTVALVTARRRWGA